MKQVIRGKDDWLFLAGGAHTPLEYMLGTKSPVTESYINFARNLESRSRLAERMGAKYIHVIIPDKHLICEEVFPYKSPRSLAELYFEAKSLQDVLSLIVYPQRLLKESWSTSCYKQDTHLTPAGTLHVAMAILDKLGITGDIKNIAPERAASAMNFQIAEHNWAGDLGSKVTPAVEGPKYRLIDAKGIYRYTNNLLGGNNGIIDIYINSNDNTIEERILLFGDSFGRDIAAALSRDVRQVAFLRSPFCHPEIVTQMKPTILITENVERYLSFALNDKARPSFFMFPYLKNCEYKPSREFANAFSCLMAHGRPPYHEFLRTMGIID